MIKFDVDPAHTEKLYNEAVGFILDGLREGAVTTGMTITGLQQLQGGICGSLGGLPTRTHTTGMPPNGSFKGNITSTGQIKFTLTSGSGQSTFTFNGVILSDGNIAGSYCESVKATGSCSNYGLWSVSPRTSR